MKKYNAITGILFSTLLMGAEVAAIDKPSLTLQSSAFKNNEQIPVQYTSDGPQTLPPLAWKGAPEGTKSIAIIAEDPDGVGGTKDHLVLYNIPATLDHIDEGGAGLPPEVHFGKNSRGENVWAGPKPPKGTGVHHYNFTIYALDAELKLEAGQTKEQMKKTMEGHIIAEGKLTGLYEYNKKAHPDSK